MREEMRKDRAEERPTARRGRTVKETVPMSGTNLWCRKKQERQGQEKRASYLLPITHRRFVRFGCISLRDVPIAFGRFVRFVVGLALCAPDLHGVVARRAGQAPRVEHREGHHAGPVPLLGQGTYLKIKSHNLKTKQK